MAESAAPDSRIQIEDIPIGEINFAPYNPRKKLRPSDKTYQDIKHSIETYGMLENIVWNRRTKNLVGGHQRTYVGTREWKWKTIPCKVVDLNEDDEKSLNLILNRVGEGNWDDAGVQEIINELREKKVDIYSLGFEAVEIQRIIDRKPKATKREPDAEAPAPPTKPKTRHGDTLIFITGDGECRHVLKCGDSTESQEVRRAFDDTGADRARLLFTDPPYGVSYVSQGKKGKMARRDLQNDQLRDTVLQEFLEKAFRAALSVTTKNPAAYIFYASKCHIPFKLAFEAAGWEERQQLIWIKQLVLGRSDYHWSHEPLFYCAKQGGKTDWFGTRSEKTVFEMSDQEIDDLNEAQARELLKAMKENSTVLDIARDPPSSYVHPTQKPTALARRAMKNSTLATDTVLDLFGGSGSTMIAAELETRNSVTIERDEQFADVIAQRFVQTFDETVVTKNGKEIDPATLILT